MGLFIISKIINIKKFFLKNLASQKLIIYKNNKFINSKYLLNDIKILNNYS